MTQCNRCIGDLIPYDPFVFLSPSNPPPNYTLIQAEVLRGRPTHVGWIICGWKQCNWVHPFRSVRNTEFPRHPSAFLAVFAREKDEAFCLPYPCFQQRRSFRRRIWRHFGVFLVRVNERAMVLHDRCTDDEILILARMRKKCRSV